MSVPGRKAPDGASGDVANLICAPCDRDGSLLPAFGFCQDCEEHLCETCYKHHRKAKPCKDHILLDEENMPKTRQAIASIKPSGCNVPCDKHSNKMLEFFCKEHTLVLCCVCSTLDHRSCKVDYIPDISDEYVKSKDYSIKSKRLESLLKSCHDTYVTSTVTTKIEDANAAEILNRVDKFRNEIDAVLDQWQSTIKQQVGETKKTNVEKLTNIGKCCLDIKSEITNLQSRIDQMKSSGQTDRVFVEIMQALPRLDENESLLQKYKNAEYESGLMFEPNERFTSMLKSESVFGDLRMRSKRLFEKASFVKEIKIKTNKDRDTCWIIGISAMSADTIVLTDYENGAVKIVDTRTSNVTSSLVMSSKPWDVTVLSNDQIAVTLPSVSCIQVLSTSQGLTKVRSMTVNGRCRGVAYGRGQLVVTYVNPGKYEIISLQGNVLFTSSSDLGLSNYPRYVDVSKVEQYIFVSDSVNSRVIKCDWNGKVCGIYEDPELDYPKGIYSLRDGSFYVCSQHTNMVHKVSADCEKMSVVMKEDDGIMEPEAICCSEDNGVITVYVSCLTCKEKYDNYVKVFRVK